MKRTVFLFLAGCLRLAAQGMCGSPLPDWLLPSEENYDQQYASGKGGDIYDRLHVLPFGREGSNHYVSIGGQERQWYESFSTPPLGIGPDDNNGYLLQRYMLHFDVHLGSRLRVFVETQGRPREWASRRAAARHRRGSRRFEPGVCGDRSYAEGKQAGSPCALAGRNLYLGPAAWWICAKGRTCGADLMEPS